MMRCWLTTHYPHNPPEQYDPSLELFLDRGKICDLLGWSRSYYLHRLGGGSGVIEIPVPDFDQIKREFARRDRP